MSRLREKLASGGVASGIGLPFMTLQLVEMLGRIGFDWALIDGEHGATNPDDMERAIIAADLTGMSAMVRPAANRDELILSALDRGAAGVQVPHISTAQAAQGVVRAVKYEPLGNRGLAGSMRAANYGIDFDVRHYIERANRETIVCVQIEDAEGLANVNAIAAVPGVDIVFIGPMDLSQSLGYPGELDRPDFRTKVEDAIAAIRAAEKIAGTSGSIPWVQYAVEHGAQYVYTGVNNLLVGAGREFIGSLESVKSQAKNG